MANMENNTTGSTQQGTLQGNGEGVQSAQRNQQQERTFTQDEVNRIVQERLARVKASQEPDERELALQTRENALYAREKVAEFGLPKELADELNGMDKATVDKCIKIIAPFAKKASEPILNAVGPTNGGGMDTSDSAIRAAMGLKKK